MGVLRNLLAQARKARARRAAAHSLRNEVKAATGINFHRRNKDNIGDMKSSPVGQFGCLEQFTPIEIFRCRAPLDLSRKPVVIGGGGLFSNEFFANHLAFILASAPRQLICWGAGQNTHDATTPSYPAILRDFDLVGIRDHGAPYDWVPCASCMDPAFDRTYPIAHEVVLYNHLDFPGLKLQGLPELDNAESDFQRVIAFLGSGASVITTSYHGAYWATLLGRRVVVLNPFSSKFFTFRHPPVLAGDGDWQAALDRARAYTDALDECRHANLQFASRVASRFDHA